MTQIAQLRALFDEAEFANLVALLQQQLETCEPLLQTAVVNRDASALHRQAHRLKSSCEHFGAVSVAMACRKLETLTRHDADWPAIDALWPAMQRHIAQLRTGLTAL